MSLGVFYYVDLVSGEKKTRLRCKDLRDKFDLNKNEVMYYIRTRIPLMDRYLLGRRDFDETTIEGINSYSEWSDRFKDEWYKMQRLFGVDPEQFYQEETAI